MELWLLSFEERDKFTLQRVEGKQQNWWWIPPPKKKKNVTFLVSGTLLGLFRLLIQNDVSLERSIFADALIVASVPGGTKTTKAVVKGLTIE